MFNNKVIVCHVSYVYTYIHDTASFCALPVQFLIILPVLLVGYFSNVSVKAHYRADSKFAPSQWETSLQSNAVSHWLGANLKSARPLGQIRTSHCDFYISDTSGTPVVNFTLATHHEMTATTEAVKMGHQVLWFKRYDMHIICCQYIYVFLCGYFRVDGKLARLHSSKMKLPVVNNSQIVPL